MINSEKIKACNYFLIGFALLLVSVIVIRPVLASDGIPATFADYLPHVIGSGADSGTAYIAPGLVRSLVKIKPDKPYLNSSIQLTIHDKTIKIEFDPGPSEDPTFIVQVNGGEQVEISGRVLYVSNAGTFYSKTYSDDYFSRARKFRIVKNTVEEVEQPYYLVDKQCKTSTVATLYTKPCNRGQHVAVLPAGTDVHILLAEYKGTSCESTDVSDYDDVGDIMSFLVATPFGLTGWVTTTSGYLQRPGRPLDCIVYHGD